MIPHTSSLSRREERSTGAMSHGSKDKRQVASASIALVALALLGGAAARTVLSPLQELMKADLGFTDNQVSLVQGAAMALPLAVVSMPIGRLVDRGSRSQVLLILALICAFGSALTAVANSFVTMFVARSLVGIAMGGALSAAVSLGADLSTAGNRSKVMGLLGMGQVIGAALAFLMAGNLLVHLPRNVDFGMGLSPLAAWRVVQLLFSLAMLALASLLFLLHEPPRQEVEAQVLGLGAVVREVMAHRRVLVPLVIGMISVNMADAAANIWAVPVLTRSLHLQPSEFGSWMGLLLLAAGFAGVILGGLLGDLGQRLGGRPGTLGAAALVSAVAAPMAFFPVMATVPDFAALFGLLMLLGAATGVIGTAAITVVIPNELRGITLSLAGVAGIVFGLGIAPTLVSFIAQVAGFGDDIRTPLTIVGLATGVIGAVAYLVAMRAARKSRPTA